jgi:hypothetical protein
MIAAAINRRESRAAAMLALQLSWHYPGPAVPEQVEAPASRSRSTGASGARQPSFRRTTPTHSRCSAPTRPPLPWCKGRRER